MNHSRKKNLSPKEHISAIFDDYAVSARILETLTNLSNTVIETALSGQCKFLFEILQNADDAFDDSSKDKCINLQLILLDNYLIIQHNGKVFDYYDVERICDYASQIEEVKANDLSKTGYKGLGFKSLFNLSDCIYIYSNGYSFRFDKNFWSDPEKKPWQVIPIWCENLPSSKAYPYDKPVNFLMKISDTNQLNIQLKELIDHPELLLYLRRVNSVIIIQNGEKYIIKRQVEKFGLFNKIIFRKNQQVASSWLSRTYKKAVSSQLKSSVREVSKFIFPDKIKNAEEIDLTFTLRTNQNFEEPVVIDGFCYSTLPTQLQLSFPYHINSNFILNLDRTQFHENEWNEFLICQIGYLQLSFLKDLTEVPHLKNYVIQLFLGEINHPYSVFNKAFSKGFEEAKNQIAWLPAHKGGLLKLGEACVDKIEFFKQNFQHIESNRYVIDYDVLSQNLLCEYEAKSFDYDSLYELFPQKYYPCLTVSSYKNFLSYIYEISQKYPSKEKLSKISFLKTKNNTLISPNEALLENEINPIPDFVELNPVDNEFLPAMNSDSFKNWLVSLGAKRLETPVHILRESVFQWIKSNSLQYKMNTHNHKSILSYLAKNFRQFNCEETQLLKKNLLILTKSNEFKIITSCYLPNAIALEELGEILSDDKIISSNYDLNSLKDFFFYLEIPDYLPPVEVFRKCILVWIKDGTLKYTLTINNYKPIIEFLSSEYQKIEYLLSRAEKASLKKLPILTTALKFQEAQRCYFDTAIPNIAGFEDVIERDKLVSNQGLNNIVHYFLLCIGVKDRIDPLDVFRNSILRWIKNGTAKSKISKGNHHAVLNMIAELWNSSLLQSDEKKMLRKLPVLTKNNNFREVSSCFWQTTSVHGLDETIPKLENIISADELVSNEYYADEKERPCKTDILSNLGVRYLNFADICDRYCSHLKDFECIEWFFSHLIKYWKTHGSNVNGNKLLTDLKVKLCSSDVLAKNGKIYCITDLYSSDFLSISSIDENAVPVLAFDSEAVPKTLEKWLGIRQELDLPCLIKLLEAFDKKGILGEITTLKFFELLLGQLRLKNKNEIRKYPFKLLSSDNNLTLAKNLYYFKEEGAVCLAESYYLKRIYGMSHSDTLELAELCGVNLLSFSQEVDFGVQNLVFDKTLRNFYLERLPLIVLQESKKLNEKSQTVLQNLFSKIRCFELHKCQTILIKYPFGKPIKRRYYCDDLKIYVTGNWKNHKSKIHKYLKKTLKLKSDITEILDLECVDEYEEECIDQKDVQKLVMIKKELKKLLPDHESSENELYLEQPMNTVKERGTPKKHKNKARKSGTPKSPSLLYLEHGKILQGVTYDEPHLKRFGEKYVFTFLQSYYKHKYPKAQINSDCARYTLQYQTHSTEIIWLNYDVDKELNYDFLLKKNGEIRQYINVEPVNQVNGDLNNLMQLSITRSSKFDIEDGEHNAKYCVYYIFYKDNPPISFTEEINVDALLKIMPLRIPSV